MNCTEYRQRYAAFWNIQPVKNEFPIGYHDWFRHQTECEPCSEWAKRQYCHSRGINPDQHCCLSMAHACSHPIEITHQGPNRVLDWIAAWNEYLIPISYDGYAATEICYCPWCGSKLPKSQKESWYQALYGLGFDDPGEQDIPDAFNSDRWWREGHSVCSKG